MATIRVHPNNIEVLPEAHPAWDDFVWEANLAFVGNKGQVVFDNPTPWNLDIRLTDKADRIGKKDGDTITVGPRSKQEVEASLKWQDALSINVTVSGSLQLRPPTGAVKSVDPMSLMNVYGHEIHPNFLTPRPIIIISRSDPNDLTSLFWALLSLILAALFGGLLGKSRR